MQSRFREAQHRPPWQLTSYIVTRNRDRPDSDGRPDRDSREIEKWARGHGLPHFDDRVHVPDFRIEYELEGRDRDDDLESSRSITAADTRWEKRRRPIPRQETPNWSSVGQEDVQNVKTNCRGGEEVDRHRSEVWEQACVEGNQDGLWPDVREREFDTNRSNRVASETLDTPSPRLSHGERPHQGLGNELIDGTGRQPRDGPVRGPSARRWSSKLLLSCGVARWQHRTQ